MNIILHQGTGAKIAEFTSDSYVITREQDALHLMEELFESGARQIILHAENLAPDFFNLRTGLAGAVLQKFVNYRLQVAIVGDFQNVTSDSLKAFIYESNRGRQIFFLETAAAAVEKLTAVNESGFL